MHDCAISTAPMTSSHPPTATRIATNKFSPALLQKIVGACDAIAPSIATSDDERYGSDHIAHFNGRSRRDHKNSYDTSSQSPYSPLQA